MDTITAKNDGLVRCSWTPTPCEFHFAIYITWTKAGNNYMVKYTNKVYSKYITGMSHVHTSWSVKFLK